MQNVSDPQRHIDRVQRFGQKVTRARRQGPLARLRASVGREYENRNVGATLRPALDQLHDRKPVGGWHLKVKQQQVGMGVLKELDHVT